MNSQNISKNESSISVEAGNRYIVYNIINNMPGIRYMELKRLTGLSYGTLTYHLTMLERESKIRVVRSSRKSRYYPNMIGEIDIDIIDCVRSEICRGILLLILREGKVTLDMLVKRIQRAKTTLKYHIDRLRAKRLIEKERVGRFVFYYVKDRRMIERITMLINWIYSTQL
ncbi:hypothetical protein HRbin04_01225 [archaeon HR04]|nr:hypothetical protein HRbin04_01225 [archaeon HR04]